MSKFLSSIGKSEELRKLVSEVDVHPTTISLILDKPRTLEVIRKSHHRGELIVRCKDTEDKATVILNLPYAAGSVAQATIISYHERS